MSKIDPYQPQDYDYFYPLPLEDGDNSFMHSPSSESVVSLPFERFPGIPSGLEFCRMANIKFFLEMLTILSLDVNPLVLFPRDFLSYNNIKFRSITNHNEFTIIGSLVLLLRSDCTSHVHEIRDMDLVCLKSEPMKFKGLTAEFSRIRSNGGQI
jgi:hypothetical protein